METWPIRIKERMQALGITQEELARQMGLTRSAVTHYLAGRREPPMRQFQRLADILETEPAWLMYGAPTSTKTTDSTTKPPKATTQPIAPTPPIKRKEKEVGIPLISNPFLLSTRDQPTEPMRPAVKPVAPKAAIPIVSWEQAAAFIDVTQLKNHERKELIPHFYTDKARWYALHIKDDTMAIPCGHNKSFHVGDVIIIDPDKLVTPGDFVIALLPQSKEATFKQYVIDGGIHYLKPLNPQYPLIPFDKNTYVCGVVIACLNAL